VSPPPVGLYSIGIRRLDAGEFLGLAARWQVPFAHLRGGSRGYDLARIPSAQLTAWARQAREAGVPVTMVTADIDLADFTAPGTARYQQAAREFAALAAAAAELGARAIRLLASAVPRDAAWETLSVPMDAAPGMAVLAELHDPGWFTPAAAARLYGLLDRTPGLALLLDSAQVHDAWLTGPAASWPGLIAGLAARAGVVHLSDRGTGLDQPGHQLLARAARAAAGEGRQAETAFEWTGADRSPQACLARYRGAAAWHVARCEESP
jgi:hypothetical protein